MKLNLLKKILSIILTAIFFLSLNVLPAQAAGVCSEDIYWSNINGNESPSSLGRAVVTNSVIASVNNSYLNPTTGVTAIQGDSNFLYFGDLNGDVFKFDRATRISTLIESLSMAIFSIALKDGKLYVGGEEKLFKFTVGADGTLSGKTDIYSLLGFGEDKSIDGLAVDSQYLYYSTPTDNVAGQKFIGRAKLDGSEYNGDFIPLPATLDSGSHLEVDSNYIYWSNFANSIKRADLNGSNITTLISSNRMETFEIDSNYIYLDHWNGSAPYSIARANLDGTSLDLNYITTGNQPIAVYVDINFCASSGDSASSSTVKSITPTVEKTPDVVFNLKNKKYLSKNALKTKLRKNKSFKRVPEDLYKYSIFKASKKTCVINGNYVTGLKKTGTCNLYATRTTTKGIKYKYSVQINYIK